MNFEKLLGEIVRNSAGDIVSAGSVVSVWVTDVNFTLVDMNKAGNDIGTADWVCFKILQSNRNFIPCF